MGSECKNCGNELASVCMQCHACMGCKEPTSQAARIAELEAAVKALGDCIKATCKRHKMEVATLAILNNPIAAAAVREASK